MRTGVLLVVVGLVGVGCQACPEKKLHQYYFRLDGKPSNTCPSAEELGRDCGKYCGDPTFGTNDAGFLHSPGKNCTCASDGGRPVISCDYSPC